MIEELSVSAQAPYTADEVLANFSAVLDSMDFARELAVLGVKRLHFRRRERLIRELRALSIGLWRLALHRSFPQDGETLFEMVLARLAEAPAHSREAQRALDFIQLARGYVELLREKGDTDFMVASSHIVGLFKQKEQETASRSLKLALLIRNTYTVIFDRLI